MSPINTGGQATKGGPVVSFATGTIFAAERFGSFDELRLHLTSPNEMAHAPAFDRTDPSPQMDYLSRRSAAATGHRVALIRGRSPYPRLAALGVRIERDTVRHREIAQALLDLGINIALPLGDIPAAELEAALADYQPEQLRRDIDEFLQRLAREGRLHATARLLFADDESVREWLRTPAPALNGSKPIDLLETDAGAAEVEGLIRGLAYGNFQ